MRNHTYVLELLASWPEVQGFNFGGFVFGDFFPRPPNRQIKFGNIFPLYSIQLIEFLSDNLLYCHVPDPSPQCGTGRV